MKNHHFSNCTVNGSFCTLQLSAVSQISFPNGSSWVYFTKDRFPFLLSPPQQQSHALRTLIYICVVSGLARPSLFCYCCCYCCSLLKHSVTSFNYTKLPSQAVTLCLGILSCFALHCGKTYLRFSLQSPIILKNVQSFDNILLQGNVSTVVEIGDHSRFCAQLVPSHCPVQQK